MRARIALIAVAFLLAGSATLHVQRAGVPVALAAQQAFLYTGGEQQFVVPVGVTSVHVFIHGASGSVAGCSNPGWGEVSVDLAVTSGSTLYVIVGNVGSTAGGGFNGGGAPSVGAVGGAGATDIRTQPLAAAGSLNSRILVAGGGGGGMMSAVDCNLGVSTGGGGGPNGNAGFTVPKAGAGGGGGGGTQAAGGGSGTGACGAPCAGVSGSLGIGGAGGIGLGVGAGGGNGGGGGGGGYYGGGGGGGGNGAPGGGGGGGSNFVTPVGTSNVFNLAQPCTAGPFCAADVDGLARFSWMPPTAAKSFNPASIAPGGTSTLTVNLTNNGPSPLTGIDFTDAFPVGLTVTASPGLANTCGGTATAAANGNQLSLTGGLLALGASCQVSVNVTAAISGNYSNQTGPITSSQGAGVSAAAILTVGAAPVQPPTPSKAFSPNSIASGGTTRLSLGFSNPNAGTQLTNISISDTLPAGMIVAPAPNVTQTCGGSTVVTAVAGAGVITVTGGVLAANASCTVGVDVTATGSGSVTNTTGTVSSQESGAGVTASGQLMITASGGGGSSAPTATPTPSPTPVPPFVPAVIPQTQQNPAAIAAIMGAALSGNKKNP